MSEVTVKHARKQQTENTSVALCPEPIEDSILRLVIELKYLRTKIKNLLENLRDIRSEQRRLLRIYQRAVKKSNISLMLTTHNELVDCNNGLYDLMSELHASKQDRSKVFRALTLAQRNLRAKIRKEQKEITKRSARYTYS